MMEPRLNKEEGNPIPAKIMKDDKEKANQFLTLSQEQQKNKLSNNNANIINEESVTNP